jgi:hypothetical protein
MFRSASCCHSWLSQIRRVLARRYDRTGVPRIIQSGSGGQTGFCDVLSLRRNVVSVLPRRGRQIQSIATSESPGNIPLPIP